MTLEQARKRRSQCDLIDELADALESLARESHDGLCLPLAQWVFSECHHAQCTHARDLIEKAKEHDCIPWDDAREAAER